MVRASLAVLLGGVLLAALVGPASADSKSGEARFTGPKKESVKVTAGDKLKLEAEFQQISIGELSAVRVRATITNTAAVRMHYSYNVAFLDKDKNLIGCQAWNLELAAGKQDAAGTFIRLSPDQIAKIAYYSVAFYEGDKPIGSK